MELASGTRLTCLSVEEPSWLAKGREPTQVSRLIWYPIGQAGREVAS